MRERRPRDRKRAHGLGLLAEHVSVVLLRLKGYRVLARRYQIRGGEIDIVARRGDTVAFVEVKVRPNSRRGTHVHRRRQAASHLVRGTKLACFEPLGG